MIGGGAPTTGADKELSPSSLPPSTTTDICLGLTTTDYYPYIPYRGRYVVVQRHPYRWMDRPSAPNSLNLCDPI